MRISFRMQNHQPEKVPPCALATANYILGKQKTSALKEVSVFHSSKNGGRSTWSNSGITVGVFVSFYVFVNYESLYVNVVIGDSEPFLALAYPRSRQPNQNRPGISAYLFPSILTPRPFSQYGGNNWIPEGDNVDHDLHDHPESTALAIYIP